MEIERTLAELERELNETRWKLEDLEKEWKRRTSNVH